MAIFIKTKNPQYIVDEIRKRIDNAIIDTWSYDNDGDFTHIGQWKNKAWFSPTITGGVIAFMILGRKNVKMSLMEYSVYHGRFVEMVINQFPRQIVDIQITMPNQISGDNNNIEIV